MATYIAILANVKVIGGVLLLTSPVHLYLPYLLSPQADAGTLMLALTLSFFRRWAVPSASTTGNSPSALPGLPRRHIWKPPMSWLPSEDLQDFLDHLRGEQLFPSR